MVKIDNLTTEKRNEKTLHLDEMNGVELAQIMNEEDAKVSQAVGEIVPMIGEAIEIIAAAFKKGGRLIYTGAGTSGRLGVLDAVECVPTFGVAPEQVVGLIAGGEKAFVLAVEGAEDSEQLGIDDLKKINLNADDVVVGIAASGRTPYVIAGLEYANEIGAATIAVTCNKNSLVGKASKLPLEIDAGPEVLTGSTRLKSGTAQKMILNMLSTGAMVRTGKAYKNLMVDVLQTNIKLVERAKNIVMEATGVERAVAEKALLASNNHPKLAIVMLLADCSAADAKIRLEKAEGFVSKAII
ncbi:N-acetylmuramic acid 6-phosphate (MurNAc-6-P) etherase [Erysipelotrichaceae bacterium]|nr:N-acetylmuramic acid 6-phosphate (MurNAc-6-P) etherase [Erysipelotrichaceae bacterium]